MDSQDSDTSTQGNGGGAYLGTMSSKLNKTISVTKNTQQSQGNVHKGGTGSGAISKTPRYIIFFSIREEKHVTECQQRDHTIPDKEHTRGGLNVMNLSSYRLSEDESRVLSLGLSFCPNQSTDKFGVITDLNLFAKKLSKVYMTEGVQRTRRIGHNIQLLSLNLLEISPSYLKKVNLWI